MKKLNLEDIKTLKDIEDADSLHFFFYSAEGEELFYSQDIFTKSKYVVARGGFSSCMDGSFHATKAG